MRMMTSAWFFLGRWMGAAPLFVLPGLAGLLGDPSSVAAQQPCAETPGFDRLDFWVGEWDVVADGTRVGTNRIAKVLNGCAITEEWTAASGGEGRSLFYYLPRSDEWKQVWVTGAATRTGGVKEKSLVAVLPDGSLRFEGVVPDASGRLWTDRTTLTPLEGGRVRQHIEISADGVEWQTTFDAVYVPTGG